MGHPKFSCVHNSPEPEQWSDAPPNVLEHIVAVRDGGVFLDADNHARIKLTKIADSQ